MKIEPFRNPKVKTDWTKEQLQKFADQVDKYFRKAQGDKDSFSECHDCCLVCDATKDARGNVRCLVCPLGDGANSNWPCTEHPTFINQNSRHRASPLRIVRRMDYLITQFEINGLEVYDVDVAPPSGAI